MDKFLNDLYESVSLGPLKELVVTLLKQNIMAKKVLVEIAKNDPTIIDRSTNETLEGVTKEKIRLSIYTSTTRVKKGEQRGDSKEKQIRKVNPSIKVIDDAVSYLEGATLVYYENALKEKRWKLTSRGLEVISELLDYGEISGKDLE